MANDKFNIKQIYPTRANGREWYLPDSIDDINNDSRVSGDLEDDVSGGDSTAGFTIGDNGQVRLGVAPDSSIRDPSNTNLDHSTAAGRGYAFSTKDWDLRGIEMTARIKCTDYDTSDSRFIMKGPTGSHSSNTVDCSGSAYNCRFFLAPSGSDSGMVQFSKESWHVNYTSRPNDPVPSGQGQIFNQWVVLKMMFYLVDNGTHVKLELWMNKNNDGITWTKVLETVDTGGWGNHDGECSPSSDDQILTWDNARMLFRWDGPSIRFRDLSVREVDPFGTGGEPVPVPTTGTISRDWTFKYNLIVFPDNSCGIPQSGLLTEFYNVDGTSQSNLHRDRYRVCMLANGSGSKFVGKKPKSVTVRLSKTNNPPSGDISCVLRKGSDDSIAVTYDYVGAAELNATTLATTKGDYVFENIDSVYSWQNGDRLCIEYSSNTADTTNEVNVYRDEGDPFDGALSCAIKFDTTGPPPPIVYTAPDIARDYSWIISE